MDKHYIVSFTYDKDTWILGSFDSFEIAKKAITQRWQLQIEWDMYGEIDSQSLPERYIIGTFQNKDDACFEIAEYPRNQLVEDWDLGKRFVRAMRELIGEVYPH